MRMANCVTKGTNNIVVIHVDKKVDIKPFKDKLSNNSSVYFVEKRVKVFWGGYNSIVATMNSLQLATGYCCERYVLLQGCDYPICSNAEIDSFFEKHRQTEFLKAYNVTTAKTKNYMKCYGYHVWDNRDRWYGKFFGYVFIEFNRLGIKYRKGYFYDKVEKKKYEIYAGWAHFALTHDCVMYILDFYKKHTKFNSYFMHIFPPDETYIHTIVYNSPWIENTLDGKAVGELDNLLNLTYFEYPKYVRVFENKEELNAIDTSKYLYLRKVAPGCEIIDWVDGLNKKI